MSEQVLMQPTVTLESPHVPYVRYDEYLALPHEDHLIEWVNGKVIHHMPPLAIHQLLISYLDKLIGLYVDLFSRGRVFIAPFEMKCHPEKRSREPDLLFVATANLDRLGDGHRLMGPADLVIEILSDDSVSRDYDDKFVEYEECGVQEYWIVDPRPRRKRATFYQRGADGRFDSVKAENGVYRSRVLEGFWLNVAWLWDMPDPALTFGEIIGLSEQTMSELRAKKVTADQ
ncbi:MAG: Uma2 family endonuclease [Chloroflexota bacterium]